MVMFPGGASFFFLLFFIQFSPMKTLLLYIYIYILFVLSHFKVLLFISGFNQVETWGFIRMISKEWCRTLSDRGRIGIWSTCLRRNKNCLYKLCVYQSSHPWRSISVLSQTLQAEHDWLLRYTLSFRDRCWEKWVVPGLTLLVSLFDRNIGLACNI